MNEDVGYTRVPMPGGATRQPLDDERTHLQLDSGLLTGEVTGVMTVLTPLHVGTGQLVLYGDLQPPPDNPEGVELIASFFRDNDRLTIPGSSLKGAFRHLYEAVTPSCLAQTHPQHRADENLKACYYRADTRSGNSRDIRLCPACRVFGGQGYMGQVFFHVATVTNDRQARVEFAPQRWEPKIRREDEQKRKIYTHLVTSDELIEPLEVLPAGAELSLRMDFRNLTPSELGLLLMLFGQDGEAPIYPKLGAVKAHGFGAVEITIQQIRYILPEDYLNFDTFTADTADFHTYITTTRDDRDLLNQSAWNQLVMALGQRPEEF